MHLLNFNNYKLIYFNCFDIIQIISTLILYLYLKNDRLFQTYFAILLFSHFILSFYYISILFFIILNKVIIFKLNILAIN